MEEKEREPFRLGIEGQLSPVNFSMSSSRIIFRSSLMEGLWAFLRRFEPFLLKYICARQICWNSGSEICPSEKAFETGMATVESCASATASVAACLIFSRVVFDRLWPKRTGPPTRPPPRRDGSCESPDSRQGGRKSPEGKNG